MPRCTFQRAVRIRGSLEYLALGQDDVVPESSNHFIHLAAVAPYGISRDGHARNLMGLHRPFVCVVPAQHGQDTVVLILIQHLFERAARVEIRDSTHEIAVILDAHQLYLAGRHLTACCCVQEELESAEEWARSSRSVFASFVRSTLIGKSLSRFSVLETASPSVRDLYRLCFYISTPSLLMLLVALVLVLILGITLLWALLMFIFEFTRFLSAYFKLLSYELMKLSEEEQ